VCMLADALSLLYDPTAQSLDGRRSTETCLEVGFATFEKMRTILIVQDRGSLGGGSFWSSL